MWPFRRRAHAPAYTDIEPQEAHRRVVKGAVLVDVRQPSELNALRIREAVNVPLAELETYAAGLDSTTPVMLICASGNRSRKAAKRLADLGFIDLSNVRGGVNAWRRAGLPLER